MACSYDNDATNVSQRLLDSRQGLSRYLNYQRDCRNDVIVQGSSLLNDGSKVHLLDGTSHLQSLAEAHW